MLHYGILPVLPLKSTEEYDWLAVLKPVKALAQRKDGRKNSLPAYTLLGEMQAPSTGGVDSVLNCPSRHMMQFMAPMAPNLRAGPAVQVRSSHLCLRPL